MLNIVLPIAGGGTRFATMGYKNPKPFIEIHGKFMILHVVDNINIPGAKYIFLCQKSHLELFGSDFIDQLKKRSFVQDFDLIPVEGVTEGAACTVLKAKPLIDNNDELLIANGDQLVPDGDIAKAVTHFEKRQADAGLLCFFNKHIKWSYVTVEADRTISRVAEKQVISDHATCGIYYAKHGRYWVEAAERMIEKNDRTNNEFYVAPSFNYIVLEGKKVVPYFVNEMHGLGTPEDLNLYLQNA